MDPAHTQTLSCRRHLRHGQAIISLNILCADDRPFLSEWSISSADFPDRRIRDMDSDESVGQGAWHVPEWSARSEAGGGDYDADGRYVNFTRDISGPPYRNCWGRVVNNHYLFTVRTYPLRNYEA